MKCCWILVLAVALPVTAQTEEFSYWSFSYAEVERVRGDLPQAELLVQSVYPPNRDAFSFDDWGVVFHFPGGNEGYCRPPANSPSRDECRIVVRVPGSTARELSGVVSVFRNEFGFGRPNATLSTFVVRADRLVAATAREFHVARLATAISIGSRVPATAAYYEAVRRESEAAIAPLAEEEIRLGTPMVRRRFWGDVEPRDAFDLFTGAQAIIENLQLDRVLNPIEGGEPTVLVNELKGIDLPDYDWSKEIEGKAPVKDVLAASLPGDQYAVFFPSITAFSGLVALANNESTPILGSIEERSEDAGVLARYERQLGWTLEKAALDLAATTGSWVVTGSDAEFRTGADVAILVVAADTAPVLAWFRDRQEELVASIPGASMAVFDLQGNAVRSVVDTTRTASSYLMAIEGAVVVGNSRSQLARILDARSGAIPKLADAPEYTFYRDRYRLGDPEESALIVLSDAAIRRWCSPLWRIGASRRTRALALLQQVGVASVLAGGEGRRAPPSEIPKGLGEVSWSDQGPHSSKYGSVHFQTPVLELEIARVTEGEANAYERFRTSYLSQWRDVFDPIAIRLGITSSRLELDVSVRPLNLSTEYRWLMRKVGAAGMKSGDGDRHDDTLFDFSLSVDVVKNGVRSFFGGGRNPVIELEDFSLVWMKGGIGGFIDDTPESRKFVSDPDLAIDKLSEIPFVFWADVKEPVLLAAFLTSIKAIELSAAPGLTKWESKVHEGVPYSRVSPETDSSDNFRYFGMTSIYYAATSERLYVSLNEPALLRAIDRLRARRENRVPPQKPWLGESFNLRLRSELIQMLFGYTRDEIQRHQQRLAWRALPMLDLWHHHFPKEDPTLVHARLFGVRPICPGGGRYVYDQDLFGHRSEFYGHPADPKDGPIPTAFIDRILDADFGITFEHNGLRARSIILLKPK